MPPRADPVTCACCEGSYITALSRAGSRRVRHREREQERTDPESMAVVSKARQLSASDWNMGAWGVTRGIGACGGSATAIATCASRPEPSILVARRGSVGVRTAWRIASLAACRAWNLVCFLAAPFTQLERSSTPHSTCTKHGRPVTQCISCRGSDHAACNEVCRGGCLGPDSQSGHTVWHKYARPGSRRCYYIQISHSLFEQRKD